MSERPAIMVSRTGGFLRGCSPLDEDQIRALPGSRPLKALITQPKRSSPQNRLYWALLSVVAENLDQQVPAEALHAWLKMRLGYVHEIKLRTGEIVEVPASIAFDKMDHATFTGFFNAAKDLICSQIIPKVNSIALEHAAREMLGESV